MYFLADLHFGLISDNLGNDDISKFNATVDFVHKAFDRCKGAMIIAGDIFNSVDVKSGIMSKVLKLFDDVSDRGIYMIPGNHDYSLRDNALSVILAANIPNVHVINEQRIVEIEGTKIGFVPHIPKHLRKPDFGDFYFENGSVDVVVAHGEIMGMFNSDYAEGNAMVLPSNLSVPLLAGHIHDAMIDRKLNIKYIGSPIQCTYGDESVGVGCLELIDGNVKNVDIQPKYMWMTIDVEDESRANEAYNAVHSIIGDVRGKFERVGVRLRYSNAELDVNQVVNDLLSDGVYVTRSIFRSVEEVELSNAENKEVSIQSVDWMHELNSWSINKAKNENVKDLEGVVSLVMNNFESILSEIN